MEENEIERRFAQRFRQSREAQGLSRSQVTHLMRARGFDLYDNALAKIELGQRPIRYGEAWALAMIVGQTPTDMMRLSAEDEELDWLRDKLVGDTYHLENLRRENQRTAQLLERLEPEHAELLALVARREAELAAGGGPTVEEQPPGSAQQPAPPTSEEVRALGKPDQTP